MRAGIFIVLSMLVGALITGHIGWVIAAIVYVLVVELLID